jgi:hypothetical protein
MRLTDRLKRWWKPAQWQEDHPLSEQERENKAQFQTEDEYINPQHGIGAESYDRVDVDRDFRKP